MSPDPIADFARVTGAAVLEQVLRLYEPDPNAAKLYVEEAKKAAAVRPSPRFERWAFGMDPCAPGRDFRAYFRPVGPLKPDGKLMTCEEGLL